MFQPPVNNLEKIRRARKRVKQMLLQIGLESCKDILEEYRSKSFCCSMCKFSTNLLSSFKSHLKRYHEEEKDLELMSTCSHCPFTSQSKTVGKHARIFHSSVRKGPIPAVKENSNLPRNCMKLSCSKCSFTDTLYYSMKKHVLLKHYEKLAESYFGEKSEKEIGDASEVKTQPVNKFFCKKCSFTAVSHDALIYHIITSEKHRDLEQKLRADISEISRAQLKNIRPSMSGVATPQQIAVSANSPAAVPASSQGPKMVSLPQNGPSQPLGTSTAAIQNVVPKIATVADSSVGLVQKTATSVASTATVEFVTTALKQNQTITLPQNQTITLPQNQTITLPQNQTITLPQNQTITLPQNQTITLPQNQTITLPQNQTITLPQNQTITLPQNQTITLPQNQTITLPQSIFLSPRFPLNQSVTATVLPSGCNVGQILTGAQTSVKPTVLPLNQPLSRSLLPVNQSAVLACTQSVRPNVMNANQTVRPAVLNVNQAVKPGNPTTNQAGASQNTFLSAPIFRQLIPTGKQVNGIPTYTLSPITVSLPVAPCTVPAVNPPKVTVQLKKPDNVVKVSQTPANAKAVPVVSLNTTPQKAASLKTAPSPSGKEAKQWKTCPVCNELFPSNVYEVHMQIAHIKEDPTSKSADTPMGKAKEPVVIAAHTSSLKVNENIVRCAPCKTLITAEDVLQHLLMHGLVCLYCKAVFHELINFVYHMKIMHQDKKTIHADFLKKGLTIPTDDDCNALFPRFDFKLKVSRDELGDREINLAVVTGVNPKFVSALYIKIKHNPNDDGAAGNKQTSKCPFCKCSLSKTELYETHLKEKHHIMPTVHTILKTPAFKCIYCCGVYTGSMTLSAIAVHLLRCRNAPKDSSFGVEVPPEDNAAQALKGGGMHDYAKQNTSSEDQIATDEANQQTSAGEDFPPVPHKRRRVDVKQDQLDIDIEKDSLEILAIVPDKSETSHESKKEFLTKYFNKRPYPSKKELLLLATLLDMWKGDVASYIGTKRYLCMKSLRNNRQRVLLGFQMLKLQKLKHDLTFNENEEIALIPEH
ncbi:activity-dependent neuroprotector homeobox protein 2 isoform X2 [Spea bombifrons]|uniref:activity-dependent neuroprotector homeobox protein 2 isoform X2 n=1 Tax=Spea bombifrons TaxID=233779 RepID=UPI00234B98A8|nr:activity-dependent neuroprotector homeobox protein 2 isoform X2 [Spea bombifrons]